METDFNAFEWHRLLLGEQPVLYYLEVLARAVVIFCLLLLVMRLMGKRGQQNLSPMQQMLMIALGSSAGDALLYPTVALGYAAVVLIVVTLMTVRIERAGDHSRHIRDALESHPRVLVRDGCVDRAALDEERTNERELYASLRQAGARSIEQVELAVLEVTGVVSVFLNDRHPVCDDLLQELRKQPMADAGPPPPETA